MTFMEVIGIVSSLFLSFLSFMPGKIGGWLWEWERKYSKVTEYSNRYGTCGKGFLSQISTTLWIFLDPVSLNSKCSVDATHMCCFLKSKIITKRNFCFEKNFRKIPASCTSQKHCTHCCLKILMLSLRNEDILLCPSVLESNVNVSTHQQHLLRSLGLARIISRKISKFHSSLEKCLFLASSKVTQ